MTSTKASERYLAYAFGVLFVLIILLIALALPRPTAFQYGVFRIVLALAAAGAAAMLPGFLEVQVGAAVRAGGTLGVFVIAYFFNPASLVTAEDQSGAGRSQLELVDLGYIDTLLHVSRGGRPKVFGPALDIKLRNTGSLPAFLKRADIRVLDTVRIPLCMYPDAVPVSYVYDLNLDSVRSVSLSQQVPARGVDRFLLRLGSTHDTPLFATAYHLKLRLFANSPEDTLVTEDFAILGPMGGVLLGGHPFFIGNMRDTCLATRASALTTVATWPRRYSLPDIRASLPVPSIVFK